jgi:hypothetical protein
MTKFLLLLAGLMSLSPIPPQSNAERDARMKIDIALFQEPSRQINELAGNVRSLDDSRRIVDLIAAVFADDLPPAWGTRPIREQIAQAEYESASEQAQLIPEQRIVDAWNRYVTTIGASQDAVVSVAEIHNLRDGSYSAARFMWSRGTRSIWSVPSIYATGRDGKVADGCTAVEALRVLYDLSNQFGNLEGARERVKQGVSVSDTLKPLPEGAVAKPAAGRITLSVGRPYNPVEDAEMRYMREHGARALNRAVEALLYDTFPS